MEKPLRCAGALIVDDAGRIFVQRRSPHSRLFAGCWDIVGGHVEPGESVDEALRREVREETGWELTIVLGPVHELSYRGDDGIDRVEEDFLVRVEGDLDRPSRTSAEHTEFRWLGPQEIDELDRAPGDELLRRTLTAGFDQLRQIGT